MTTTFDYWGPIRINATQFPTHFRTIASPPFSKRYRLPTSSVVHEAEFVVAAIETGYGPLPMWHAFKAFSKPDRIRFADMMAKRIAWLLSTLDFNNGEVALHRFCMLMESSELVTISYYLGQAGTRLAANRWLAKRPVRRMLHFGLYTNGCFVKRGALIKAVSRRGTRMTPDLLVEDEKRNWHLFEAKGGGPTYRQNAINKGLKQLAAIVGIGQKYATRPKSSVCTFTHIEKPSMLASPPLSFDLVDPLPDKALPPGELLILADVAYLRGAIIDRLVTDRLHKQVSGLATAIPVRRVMQLSGTNTHVVRSGLNFESLSTRIEVFDEFHNQLRRRNRAGTAALFHEQIAFNKFIDIVQDNVLGGGVNDLALRSTVIATLRHSFRPVRPDDSGPEYTTLLNASDALGFGDDVAWLLSRREQVVEQVKQALAATEEGSKWAAFATRSGDVFLSRFPVQ